MADDGPVKIDPALERWNRMREDTYKHFKWTRRTTTVGIMYMVVIPGLAYYLFAKTDLKYDWVGKRKGESLTARK